MTQAEIPPTTVPTRESVTPQVLDAKQVESLVLLPGGVITVAFSGATFELRRPTLGEFEKLQEAAFDVQEALYGVANDAMKEGVISDADIGPDGEAAVTAEPMSARLERWKKANQFNRGHRRSATAETAIFVHKAFELLADHPVGDGFADWPMWLVKPQRVNEWINHWQLSDPVAPGSNGTRPDQGTAPNASV